MANSVGAWPLVVVLGLLLLAAQIIVVRLMVWRVKGELALGAREVVIGAGGVEINMPVARAWYDRSLINQVVQGKEGWILLGDSGTATMVPREALTDEQIEAMQSFAYTDRHADRS